MIIVLNKGHKSQSWKTIQKTHVIPKKIESGIDNEWMNCNQMAIITDLF